MARVPPMKPHKSARTPAETPPVLAGNSQASHGTADERAQSLHQTLSALAPKGGGGGPRRPLRLHALVTGTSPWLAPASARADRKPAWQKPQPPPEERT